MEILSRFYSDTQTRKEVEKALTEHLDSVVLRKAYHGESTEGADMAREALRGFFRDLERTYGKKPEGTRKSAV